VLIERKDEIFTEITADFTRIQKNKESAIITLCFEDEGKKYPGDYSAFKKILIANGLSVFYSKYNKEARSPEQLCSVCRSIVPEVYGFASTYNFYTVDKPGMVAGGFDQSKAWKDYPVCKNCALVLENGKKYLDESAQFKFYGFSYYVIPKPVLSTLISEIYEKMAEYHKEGFTLKISGKYRNLLDETQEEILECLSEGENSFLVNILIFERSNNEFKILSYIEDIFPSRLRQLFVAKDSVDEHNIIHSCEVTIFQDGKAVKKPNLDFSFNNFRYFFNKQEKKDAYFLDIVQRIFTGRGVSYPFLMWAISTKIRDQFNQGYMTKEACMRGLSALIYLNKLGLLIDYSEGNSMNREPSSVFYSVAPREAATIAEQIFTEFTPFFNQEAKKAIFLEGVLAQLLLDIQYRERDKATPFRVKLQGLKLDQRTIQKLLPMIQNKLEEYGKNYYRDLERLISEYMLAAGDKWNLSKDEISYYFVLGMNLAPHFKSKTAEPSEGAE
jgi:CRISPR-associated protein Csh1